MANAVFYSNTAQQTTLTGSISSGATSINVAATTGFPGTFPFTLALDYGGATEELVSVTAVAALTLTVTRGYGSTSAQSHSLGAVVRHTYNAVDATDFRTHEAATSTVHGVTGALVGATSTQTLTNKTLTSPTINAGALSGTFTGSPTLSGTVTYSGTLTSSAGSLTGSWAGSPTFTGGPTINTLSALFTRTNATDPAIRVRLDADSQSRLIIQADGTHVLGSGAATGDVSFYRSAAKILGVLGTLRAEPTDTAVDGLAANLPSGTAGDLLNLRVNSSLLAAIGSDGAFRTYSGNAPTTYTPTVANGGTVTWTTRTGTYWKVGKIVFLTIYLQVNAAGSGVGNITITAPSSIDRTHRQMMAVNIEGSGTTNGAASLMAFTGGSGSVFDRIRVYDGGSTTGGDLTAGTLITAQGWYREA